MFELIFNIELNDWNVDGLKSDKRYCGSGAAVTAVAAVEVDDDEETEGCDDGLTASTGGTVGTGVDSCFSSLSKYSLLINILWMGSS